MNIEPKYIQRFHKQYEIKKDGCWWWTGTIQKPGKRNQNAYGHFHFYEGTKKCQIGAHRASYVIHKGQIPEGLHVLHSCDNPTCVNPNHLRVGTARENALDQQKRAKPYENGSRRWISWGEIEMIRFLFKIGVRVKAVAEYANMQSSQVISIRDNKTHTVKPDDDILVKYHGFKIV